MQGDGYLECEGIVVHCNMSDTVDSGLMTTLTETDAQEQEHLYDPSGERHLPLPEPRPAGSGALRRELDERG